MIVSERSIVVRHSQFKAREAQRLVFLETHRVWTARGAVVHLIVVRLFARCGGGGDSRVTEELTFLMLLKSQFSEHNVIILSFGSIAPLKVVHVNDRQ